MRRSNIISVAAIAALIFGCSDQPAPTAPHTVGSSSP
jgi:hypothetical protein